MRYNIYKKHSTKSERLVYEILKELHISFKHRWLIHNLEVDFLIGRYAVDIDGHEQDGERNHKIASLGFVPIHFTNDEIIHDRENIKTKLLQLCHSQNSQMESQVSVFR